jgi:hypothetical protein
MQVLATGKPKSVDNSDLEVVVSPTKIVMSDRGLNNENGFNW